MASLTPMVFLADRCIRNRSESWRTAEHDSGSRGTYRFRKPDVFHDISKIPLQKDSCKLPPQVKAPDGVLLKIPTPGNVCAGDRTRVINTT